MSGSDPSIYLSFDVEEFDLPNEYGADLPLEKQLEIGQEGFQCILPWLNDLGTTSTLFTTARFGKHAAELLREASQNHEIASHGVRHDTFQIGDYAESRTQLEDIVGTKILGFRRPRLQPIDVAACREAGYSYDSSENPIRLPGRLDGEAGATFTTALPRCFSAMRSSTAASCMLRLTCYAGPGGAIEPMP